ncbi:D-beta-hydroxybutyrate dehydrogenase, mitochondrial-like [Crassostrea virginica]|uniref:D-beta-hydroxybutyrate dehydrogenase, mitochondrial-like n=1 Tax=Crassostrea virginica TaxID=6565 RepID=A0A8B8BZ77_CRAVI|nr:D-beta-hydroxybutyrate dehydrogenase, mitochondrial-like [Crassostrea virginica]
MFVQIALVLFVLLVLYISFEWRGKHLIYIEGQGVFITGCDSGFGHEVVKRLDKIGFTVFAGCLDPEGEGAKALKDNCSENVHIVKLDVTKEEDIQQARAYIEKVHEDTGCGLWGVVNNAGIDLYGDVELLTMDLYRKVADVNLWGTIHVTKVFLPLIRKSKGRVIIVTSVKGRIYYPCISAYGVTKHGLETFSDCLRVEMERFGVKVSLIEPGNFSTCTDIVKGNNYKRLLRDRDSMWEAADVEIKETYGKEYFFAQYERLAHLTSSYPNCNPVSDAIEDALMNENPAARYLVAGGVGLYDDCILARIINFLPTCVMDYLSANWALKGLPRIKALVNKK